LHHDPLQETVIPALSLIAAALALDPAALSGRFVAAAPEAAVIARRDAAIGVGVTLQSERLAQPVAYSVRCDRVAPGP
jgi:hypothetical protein